MNKKKICLLCIGILLLFLSGCGNKNRLKDGTCKGRVYFRDIPKEFSMMDEHVKNLFTIRVELTNLTTEKEYEIVLDTKNEFREDIMMHPGTYRINSVFANGYDYTGITVTCDKESVEFRRDIETLIPITISDPESVQQFWMDSQPQPEIRVADQYSAMIQVNRKVIPIENILDEMNADSSVPVEPYKKQVLSDTAKGLSVTVENDTGEEQPASACKVIAVTASKSCILFPEGVSVATAPEVICNRDTGVYGEPTKFTGMMLFGWNLDTTNAIYQDAENGRRITISLSGDGSAVETITYELGIYE